MTIGFNAVSSLAAAKVDAATGFWNAEGVALRRQGVPIRVFKVNDYGAPPYPELILTTSRHTLDQQPGLVRIRGRRHAAAATPSPSAHPAQALDDLLAADPALDRAEQRPSSHALLPDLRPKPFDPGVLHEWAAWDLGHGLLERPLDVSEAFDLG